VNSANAKRTWYQIADELLQTPGVATGRLLRAKGMSFQGRYFAMLHHGMLVVKLPAARVDELERSGAGQRFQYGQGRIMREWIAVPGAREDLWSGLAMEVLGFARLGGTRGRGGDAPSRGRRSPSQPTSGSPGARLRRPPTSQQGDSGAGPAQSR